MPDYFFYRPYIRLLSSVADPYHFHPNPRILLFSFDCTKNYINDFVICYFSMSYGWVLIRLDPEV